jgi:Centromere kinetochore component CENP-T histone fold
LFPSFHLNSFPLPNSFLVPLYRVNDSSDLATFAKHAGRKGIEESDVQMLLQRQRQIKPQGAKNSVFSVAQKFLPGELLGRVRMVKGGVQKRKGRALRGRNVDDGDDDD